MYRSNFVLRPSVLSGEVANKNTQLVCTVNAETISLRNESMLTLQGLRFL
jgi:hypothetical protein